MRWLNLCEIASGYEYYHYLICFLYYQLLFNGLLQIFVILITTMALFIYHLVFLLEMIPVPIP